MTDYPDTAYQKTINFIVNALSTNSSHISVPRLFFEITHDLALSAMIAHLIFWSKHTSRADGFVFKSSRDWYNELGVSNYAVRKFKKLPFIITKVIRANGSPTTHYRIDGAMLNDSLVALALDHGLDPTERPYQVDPSTSPDEPVDGFISPLPQVEKNQTLTVNTTVKTTELTTLKELPPDFFDESEFSDPILEIDTSKTKTSPKNAPPSGKKIDPEHFKQFLAVLAEITGYDLAIKKSFSRLLIAARQLVQAGYTIPDLHNFLAYWKATDWRWKKNQQLPTPEDVLLNISRSKNYHKKSLKRWLGQE